MLFLAWEEHAHQAFLSELPKKKQCVSSANTLIVKGFE